MFLRMLAPVLIVLGVLAFRLYIGSEKLQKDVCILHFGENVMGITAYQPDGTRDEFCNDIPFVGRTLIVFDAAQHDLRKMDTEIRILREVSPEEEKKVNLNDITEAYLPPRKYPGGTVVFDHIFAEPGKFVGLVTVTDEHRQRWTDRFPLSVGRMAKRNLGIYAISAAVVVLGMAGYALSVLYRKNTAKTT